MADAVALIDGRITDIKVQKNDRVSQGQAIITITNEQTPIKIRQADIDILKAENDILNADNNIAKAETDIARAKNDYNRYLRLRERDAVTLEKFEEVESAYKAAQSNLDRRNCDGVDWRF